LFYLCFLDFSWKVIKGPVRWDNVYIGEDYDARLATVGWDKTGYNDSTWQVFSLF
jgi:alpha-L-rhamnosidase